MKQLIQLRSILISLLFLCLTASPTLSAADSAFSPLFNGKNLDGWVIMHEGSWSVEDGTIVGRNGKNWTTNPEKSGSWLRSAKEYSDFVLELEFSINSKGNSGIFFRSGIEKNPAFTGYEVQILDDHGRAPAKYTTGSLYDVVAPTKNMSKPAGEWNQLRIEAKGRQVTVWLNGEKIVDAPIGRRERGYIGLQNHDEVAVVRFRNLKLKEL